MLIFQFASYLADTFPKFRPLLKELEGGRIVGYLSHTILFVDLSIAEIDEKRKRKKKVVDNEEMILKWRSTHVESNKVRNAQCENGFIKLFTINVETSEKEDSDNLCSNVNSHSRLFEM